MAGSTIERVKQIIHDLTHSWYFRAWSLAWLVLALVVFSAMIILSKESNQAQKEQDLAVWVENASSINFPGFHFRTHHQGNETFVYYSCVFGASELTPQLCQPDWRGNQPPMNICIAFNSNSFKAVNDMQFNESRIYCEIVTEGAGPQGNLMMAFELEGTNVFAWGAGAYASTWFQPNDMTWIMLQKNVLQKTKENPSIQLWERDLLYHSTNFLPHLYNVTVIMGSFYVRHFDPRDSYNGWMTIGDIGGVGFFMACIHTLIMIIIGLFMANSSTFLNGGAEFNQ
jgi:hypothetical protein